MDDAKTDRLIASAIAALPYRRPGAGFSARVMAGIAVAGARLPWQARAAEAAGLIVSVWAAGLAFAGACLVYANLGGIAALVIQPRGLTQALSLLAGRGALLLTKAAAAVSLGFDVLSAASPALPAWYEVAAASLVCCAAIAALSHKGRLAARGV